MSRIYKWKYYGPYVNAIWTQEPIGGSRPKNSKPSYWTPSIRYLNNADIAIEFYEEFKENIFSKFSFYNFGNYYRRSKNFYTTPSVMCVFQHVISKV